MNCDRIAPWYRWAERAVYGRTLERARVQFMQEVAPGRALLLGDGDGRFLQALLASQPEASVDSVDRSERMLALARQRAQSSGVRFLHGDARTIDFAERRYDLIATHFFFDCFAAEELGKLIPRIAEAARPSTKWLVTEFRVPERDWSAPLARGLIAIMYRFFGLVSGLKTQALADHRPLLAASGFRLEREVRRWRGLIVSELWSAAG